jgi:hypothetical protein
MIGLWCQGAYIVSKPVVLDAVDVFPEYCIPLVLIHSRSVRGSEEEAAHTHTLRRDLVLSVTGRHNVLL